MKVLKWFLVLLLSLTLLGCADILPKGTDGVDAANDIVQVDGFSNLIVISNEEKGENCISGGKRIDAGLDNGDGNGIAYDGILQESEIDSSEYICNGIDGENVLIDSGILNTGLVVYKLYGKFQSLCFKDEDVLIQPLDSLTMKQTGGPFIGFTNDYLGSYEIPVEIGGFYVEIYFEGGCYNEITDSIGWQKLSGIIKVSNLVNNINILTKIRSQVVRDLFDNKFGSIDESLIEAERLILIYLGMPALDKRFTEMNLENTGIHDAVLAFTNAMILYGRTEVEQGDYIAEIVNGIITNDSVVKAEIALTFDEMPIIPVINNLETKYLELRLEINAPPVWNLGFHPPYFADLLERDPVAVSIYNLTDNTSCSFDQSTYNLFATPVTFDSGILSARFIALNFPKDAEVSVWTVGVDGNGNPAPGTKVLDITSLKEIILDDPVKLTYNGMLGDNHGLLPDTQYYFRIRKDTNFTLSKGCEGDRLTTAYTLASDDEGDIWIGDKNEADRFFYFSGIKMYLTN